MNAFWGYSFMVRVCSMNARCSTSGVMWQADHQKVAKMGRNAGRVYWHFMGQAKSYAVRLNRCITEQIAPVFKSPSFRHSREVGNPVLARVDSPLRGNDSRCWLNSNNLCYGRQAAATARLLRRSRTTAFQISTITKVSTLTAATSASSPPVNATVVKIFWATGR